VKAALIALGVAGVVILLALGLAYRSGIRVTKAEAKTEVATDTAVGKGLEAAGTKTLAADADKQRVEVKILTESSYARDRQAVADVTAQTPLPSSVADRIRDADLELCNARPALCSGSVAGVGAAPRPAGDDPRALPGDVAPE